MTVKHNKLQLATITFSVSMLLGASTYAMNYWVFFNSDSKVSQKIKNKLNTTSNNRDRNPLQRRWLIATMNKAIITSPIVFKAPRAKTKPTDEIVTKLPASSKGTSTSKTLLTAFQNKKKIKKTQLKQSLNIKKHKRKAMRKKAVTPHKNPYRIRIATVKKSKNQKPAQPFSSLEQSLGIPLY